MPNRLSKEKSPYLLQHQNNPIDWYPWGDEAFNKAASEDKPIFLSIGYATCHWCHVMEKESFENQEIAELMNQTFVNIKVDREERPDIDATYMTVCQLINGQGGWPLSIIMNANKEPFFAGTYIPKDARFNRIGMKQLIPGIKGMWANEPKRITKAITQIKKGFKKSQEFEIGCFPGTEAKDFAAEQLLSSFDNEHGGFGDAPKFPSPHNLMFLLRQFHYTKEQRFLDAVKHTLIKMRLSGLWDHVGFGFHRYSTDSKWLLPHFEKMLYDQALLMMAYTEAWQLTKYPLFKQTVEEIAEYVQRDLMHPNGAFYSAEDADSEGIEGKFYVWEADELRELLLKDYDFVDQHFSIYDEGNFKDEATREKNGHNILHLLKPLSETEAETWSMVRNRLFSEREKRIRPALDDKILTDWNALMISAYAKAGVVFQNNKFLNIANVAYSFILKNLLSDNIIYHRFKDNEIAVHGFSNDYVHLVWAGLELYNASYNAEFLENSIHILDKAIENFWDHKDGGFFLSNDLSDQPLGLQKQIYDGAIPSSNSIGLYCLIKLGRITGSQSYELKANKLGELFSTDLLRSGSSITMSMMALQFLYHNSGEIIAIPGKNDCKDLKYYLQTEFIPSKIICWMNSDTRLKKIISFNKFKKSENERTQIFVCKNYTCELPVNSIDELKKLLP